MNKTEWFGEIPSNWKVQKIQSIFRNRNDKVSDKDYEPLSVTKSGIFPQLENVAKSNDSENRKLVRMGDFVINSRSDRKQSCGVSPYAGSVSLINTVIYPYNSIDMNYVGFLFDNYGFAEEFYRWGHGIVADLWTTRWQEMANIEIPIPPLSVQKEIHIKLTEKSQKIDILITNQKQQIEKLKEYKQSLISEVVTKGLNPNVEFKDSNVKWIGLIPKNYDVSLISRHTFVTKLAGFEFTEILSKNINEFDDIPIVRAQNIKNDKFIKDFTGYINNDTARKLVRSNLDKPCILMTFIGAGVGEVAIFNEEKLHQLAPNVAKIEILKSHEDRISLRYLLYYLMSNAANFEKDQYLKATAQPNISMTIIRGLRFVLPPIDDQNKIIKYLDNKVLRLDELIELKNKKIDELYNYKKSLIYEYVTGKKEVS